MERPIELGCSAILFIISGILLYSLISDEIKLDKIEQQNQEVLNVFKNKILDNNKIRPLLDSYTKKTINIKSIKKQQEIHGNYYCILVKDHTIEPFTELNNMFSIKEINKNSKSFDFIIICEKVNHLVGNYTNGENAYQIEDIVSVIDIANSKIFEIDRELGGDPPREIHGNSYACGESKTASDFYEVIKSKLKFNK